MAHTILTVFLFFSLHNMAYAQLQECKDESGGVEYNKIGTGGNDKKRRCSYNKRGGNPDTVRECSVTAKPGEREAAPCPEKLKLNPPKKLEVGDSLGMSESKMSISYSGPRKVDKSKLRALTDHLADAKSAERLTSPCEGGTLNGRTLSWKCSDDLWAMTESNSWNCPNDTQVSSTYVVQTAKGKCSSKAE
jgi:hypothetical protein